MLTVGFDTAEPIGGASLYEEGVLAEERLMDAPLRHAETLIPLVDQLLRDSARNRREIERVSVNCGPGSFTGLRIGLATAKGLCQALGAALIPVDGTIAYRSRLPGERRVCVVVRSRRNLLYVRWFAGAKPREPIRLMREEDLIGQLREESRELILVGSGARDVYEQIAGHALVRIAPEDLLRPSALTIARIGANDKEGGRLYEAEPLYVEPILA